MEEVRSSSASEATPAVNSRLQQATDKLARFESLFNDVKHDRVTSSKRDAPLVGIQQLNRLTKVMRHLSELQTRNAHLQRKCSFLRDTHDIMALQYKLVTSSTHEKSSGGTSDFLRRVGSHVNQFISGSPSTATTDSQVVRDVSERSGAPARFGAHLTRSSSFGSIDDLVRGERCEVNESHKTQVR